MSRFSLIAALLAIGSTAAPAPPKAWETCSLTVGKEDGCKPGDQPRQFEEFLTPGAWSDIRGDWFHSDFHWDLKQPGMKPIEVTWKDAGLLGTHRIRTIRYSGAGNEFADLILAERSGGVFSPLMKWSGQMPDVTIYQTNGGPVLVLEKNFGGNLPMVATWAWVWTNDGPVQLDVSGAIDDAIRKVILGYMGYDTGIEWASLHCKTWVWNENAPRKVGEGEADFDAWFELRGNRLMPKRVEFKQTSGNNPRTIRWP